MTTEEKDIRFDYSKLRGRMVEKYGNLSNYCKESGRDRSAFNTKLNNGGFFRQEMIISIAKDLDISESEFASYFFTPQVEKS